MTEIQVMLETVTPLFLGGADPRGQPELRAASVRGALRFWLRALLGGVIGDTPDKLDDLRKAESAVFGSTEAGASAVVVRLMGEAQGRPFPPLLHNPSKTFTFQGVPPNEVLTLTLAPRPSHRIPDVACGALLMFLLFGGLGKRSRRGFGSFVVRSISDKFPLKLPDYSDVNSFSKQLPFLIQQATKAAESFVQELGLNVGTPSKLPKFAVLHNQHVKVLFCKKPFTGWEEAMKAFWNVRCSNPYRNDRVFGFAGREERQASPLHLRIVKIGDAYHLLLTAFHVHFAGQQPSWDVMQAFLNECCRKWDGIWAIGGNVQWQ